MTQTSSTTSAERPVITAPRGTKLSAQTWQTEAPLRMIMNNLDPEVAERPEDLVVYGGIGRAARNWPCLLYTSPIQRDGLLARMPSSA